MSLPTIQEVKELQAKYNIKHVHLVYLGFEGFVIAHTDEERAALEDLESCELHRFLAREFHPSVIYSLNRYFCVLPSTGDWPFEFIPTSTGVL